MNQLRHHFSGPRAPAEAAFALLEQAFEDDGFPVVIVEIDEDDDIHEVSVYADAELIDVPTRIAQLLGEHVAALSPVETEEVPDVDWVAASLEALAPVRADRFFVHGSHDRDKRRSGEIGIEIEASLAFGTGHHATTAGCLELIGRVLRQHPPRNALDLGAGTAVLGIAVAKSRRIPVLATDIDPVATRVAAENAKLNGVSAYVSTATSAGFAHPAIASAAPFDLIVANILARPLMRLAPEMARYIAPGGSLILSGILDRQRNAVLAAYNAQAFRHVTTIRRKGWSSLLLRR